MSAAVCAAASVSAMRSHRVGNYGRTGYSSHSNYRPSMRSSSYYYESPRVLSYSYQSPKYYGYSQARSSHASHRTVKKHYSKNYHRQVPANKKANESTRCSGSQFLLGVLKNILLAPVRILGGIGHKIRTFMMG